MSKSAYRLILSGLILVLIAVVGYIVIMIVVPRTKIIDSAIAFNILLGLGLIATIILGLIAGVFLPLHLLQRKKNWSPHYVWVLLVLAVIALVMSTFFLFYRLANGAPYDGLSIVLLIADMLGIWLPFSIIMSGCFLFVIQKNKNKSLGAHQKGNNGF